MGISGDMGEQQRVDSNDSGGAGIYLLWYIIDNRAYGFPGQMVSAVLRDIYEVTYLFSYRKDDQQHA